MKTTGRCPKCENDRFYVTDPVSMPDGDSSNGTMRVTIASAYLAEGGKTGFFSGMKGSRVSASCEAYVCARCGFTEWYTTGLDVLATLAEGERSSLDMESQSSRVRVVRGAE